MEKLVYLIPSDTALDRTTVLRERAAQLAEPTRGMSLVTPVAASAQPAPFACALFVWLACLDRRSALERQLGGLGVTPHGYLVTESVLRAARGPVAQCAQATLVLVRSSVQLAQADFRARLSADVAPRLQRDARAECIVRDQVVRPLSPEALPMRALFSFIHGTQGESTDVLHAFDLVAATAERELVVVERRIIRPRSR